MRNSKGFTLVELAIVLVIIGVILGGVIKGQELVKNAKLKSAYKQLQNIQIGYMGYTDRMGMAPGFGGVSTATWATATFWDDLYNDGDSFYGTSADAPKDPLGNDITAYNDAGSSALGSANVFNTDYVICDLMTTQYAEGIDTSYDDGTATTGFIRYTVDGTDAEKSHLCITLD